jgi:hypothetical protein
MPWREQDIFDKMIPIPSQPVFVLTPCCCMLRREEENTYFSLWFDLTIYHTQDEHTNYYTTDEVPFYFR